MCGRCKQAVDKTAKSKLHLENRTPLFKVILGLVFSYDPDSNSIEISCQKISCNHGKKFTGGIPFSASDHHF
jgi:hypothetical protein